MANTPVYVNTADTVIPIIPPIFTGPSGSVADPDTVTCVVTDPTGTATTYTYTGGTGLNVIARNGSGKYELDLQPFNVMTPPPAGLWHTTWVGTGAAVANSVQVFTPSFRVLPLNTLSGQTNWYIGLEELKSRLSIAQALPGQPIVVQSDYEMSLAIQAACAWINRYCGTHFYQVTEARTFPISNIYYLPIDQVIPKSITSFAIDYDGDGVFETNWTEGLNYQVYREGATYNYNYAGIDRPFDFVKVVLGTPVTPQGGQFFPFVWPFTHDDRVKITATWGWSEVPPEVQHACLLLATDLYKSKDAPYGIAGISDIGAVRVQSSPWIVDMLRPYRFSRKVVGI